MLFDVDVVFWQVVRESNPREQVLETRQISGSRPSLVRPAGFEPAHPRWQRGSLPRDFRPHTAPEGFEPPPVRLTGARTAAIVLQGIVVIVAARCAWRCRELNPDPLFARQQSYR